MIDSSEYINKWIDLSVTLSEWLENNKIDHWKFIEQSDLDEKNIGEIENHQFLLFNKCVANVVQNKIERLNNKDDLVKKYLIFEELRLINLIISSTEFNPVLIELIKPIVSIKETDYAEFLKEWHNVIAGEYTSFRKDFNIYRKGLSIKTPYFQANVVFRYKEELNRMIKNVFPPRTEINKREKVISKYLDAVERTLTMFLANREPSIEDIGTITLKTKDFTNALREVYFSDTQNKDEQYELIYNIISSARFQISKENFSNNPTGTYWGVIIYQLEIADKHITELHFKETNNFYPFPISSDNSIPIKKTDQLKVRQIALIHVYEGTQITRENAKEIAAKHGYTAKNSGEGLFQDYSLYCSRVNRKGKPTPFTQIKLKNKIELFESIISHLSDNKKQMALDEIIILKSYLENEFQ